MIKQMKLKVVNTSPYPLPKYQTAGSAAMDLHADIHESLVLTPGERQLVKTGIYIELPQGLEAQIRPRSGLAFKHGITVLNTPATIDSDYRGEYMVLLVNLGQADFTIQPGDRIAQLVIASYQQISWAPVETLDVDTERGVGRFGSTGV